MTQGAYIRVRAKTKAREETIVKKNDTYYVTVKEKPERGVANVRIRNILAETLNCDPKQLHLVKGGTTPSKTFLLIN